MFSSTLDPVALRVLGSMIEKEIVTPENYPLSVNSLIAAANQKTSREPILELSEDDVRHGLDTLETHGLVSTTRDSRVPRFEHRIRTVLNLRRDETAVICLLMLRGPQTAGELRGRAERMFAFDDIAAVQATLDRLAAREQPLVGTLPRQPGSREVRFLHLLGESKPEELAAPAPRASAPSAETLAALHQAMAELQERVLALEARLPPRAT